ncbi:unnamed protein product [Paramecium octaurelia]|uniref:RING-type domain-containing protein n=1 Tax=Paramecium octaurelia TaxID=43137 RepID=A0A8S1U231_PAROT|nr:unnamed protein product [Paramecium octaurelia]
MVRYQNFFDTKKQLLKFSRIYLQFYFIGLQILQSKIQNLQDQNLVEGKDSSCWKIANDKKQYEQIVKGNKQQEQIAKDCKQQEQIANDINYSEKIQQSTNNKQIITKPIIYASLAKDELKDIYQSAQLEIQQICYYCKKIIEENQIQLTCYHHLHLECFTMLIQNQIQNNSPRLLCLCNQYIKSQLIQNYIHDENLIEQYFNNQLKYIQKGQTKQFKICQKSEQCPFFYIETDNQSVSYCEQCDQQTQTLASYIKLNFVQIYKSY